MISIVESSRDTKSTLLYNEQKLAENKAIFLGAFNFCQEDHELTLDAKLARLRDLASLNERSQAKTIHFSLNYDPAEQLEDRKMRSLAREFHNDKRAPHYMQKVCAELERKHGLRQSGMHEALSHWQKDREPALRLEYGKDPTKPGIQRVLDYVLPTYNYTDLEELNAVLGLYRVQADRGSEFGLMYKSGGLYYRMLDDKGIKIGAPVKGSAFHDRPTLANLEKKFDSNRLSRDRQLEHIQNKIDISLHFGDTSSLGTWRQSLRRDSVEVVIPRIPSKRKHAPVGEEAASPTLSPPFDGHGFYYVDVDRKIACRDTALGPDYSAGSMLRRTRLDKQLIRLAQNPEIELNPLQKLHLLLDLSKQHDNIIAEKQVRQEDLRLQNRQRLSL